MKLVILYNYDTLVKSESQRVQQGLVQLPEPGHKLSYNPRIRSDYFLRDWKFSANSFLINK